MLAIYQNGMYATPCENERSQSMDRLTFQVEQHVRLVVLEHLRYELDVHVLHIDLLMCR
jgi:hypothetical protein